MRSRERFVTSRRLSPFLPGFIIYFFYGIKNSSEARKRSSLRKYESAMQTKSPIYTAAPDDSDMEAGGSA